jgi:hypothetical protein
LFHFSSCSNNLFSFCYHPLDLAYTHSQLACEYEMSLFIIMEFFSNPALCFDTFFAITYGKHLTKQIGVAILKLNRRSRAFFMYTSRTIKFLPHIDSIRCFTYSFILHSINVGWRKHP